MNIYLDCLKSYQQKNKNDDDLIARESDLLFIKTFNNTEHSYIVSFGKQDLTKAKNGGKWWNLSLTKVDIIVKK